jgi:hypothetical protein
MKLELPDKMTFKAKEEHLHCHLALPTPWHKVLLEKLTSKLCSYCHLVLQIIIQNVHKNVNVGYNN